MHALTRYLNLVDILSLAKCNVGEKSLKIKCNVNSNDFKLSILQDDAIAPAFYYVCPKYNFLIALLFNSE